VCSYVTHDCYTVVIMTEIIKIFQRRVTDISGSTLSSFEGFVEEKTNDNEILNLFSFSTMRKQLKQLRFIVNFDQDIQLITLRDWNLEFPLLQSAFMKLGSRMRFGDFIGIESFLKCCPLIEEYVDVELLNFSEDINFKSNNNTYTSYT